MSFAVSRANRTVFKSATCTTVQTQVRMAEGCFGHKIELTEYSSTHYVSIERRWWEQKPGQLKLRGRNETLVGRSSGSFPLNEAFPGDRENIINPEPKFSSLSSYQLRRP